MQRRNFLWTSTATALTAQAQTKPLGKSTLTVRWLGHMSFLFTSKEARILTDPFRAIPCTRGYQRPAAAADLVLLSSRLFDEGAIEVVPGDPKVLLQSGSYEVNGLKFQGISTFHDGQEGRHFGNNVVWRWTQGGINLLHLGGLAAPLTPEQRILIGQADIVFVPVGGGVKALSPEQAFLTVKDLNPRLVIPMHYRTPAAAPECDLALPDDFLKPFAKNNVKIYPTSEVSLSPQQLPKTTLQVRMFTYKNFNSPTQMS